MAHFCGDYSASPSHSSIFIYVRQQITRSTGKTLRRHSTLYDHH